MIPWRDGCPHRRRALDWVVAKWRDRHPDWPVAIGEHPDGPWCKALAVDAGLAQVDDEVIVIADGDVWIPDPAAIPAAIAALDDAAWSIPHRMVHRITDDATTALIDGDPFTTAMPTTQPAYRGWAGGGITITTRDTYRVAPLDARFNGWGQEDEAWSSALRCLVGPPWRGDADLVHLWHPPQPRQSRAVGSTEGLRLERRYRRARKDPAAMRALIEEGRRWRSLT